MRTGVAIFVSDLHLGPEDSGCSRYRLFERYLSRLIESPPEYLFLVGDIFDLWVGPSSVFAAHYANIIVRLGQLARIGTQIHYFEGNHDFHLASFFKSNPIAQVHTGPSRFQIGRFHLAVEHGDQMDPNDRGYLILRWLLRTWFVRFLAHQLPGFFIEWLGLRMSSASRKWTSFRFSQTDLERLKSVIRRHALFKYQREAYDYFIAGHVHVRDEFLLPESSASYAINLGSWFNSDGSGGPVAFEISPNGHRWIELKSALAQDVIVS